MARLAEHVLLVRAGKEKSVAATKTYTGQLLALYLIAYALGADIASTIFAGCPRMSRARSRWKRRISSLCRPVHVHGPCRGGGLAA